MSLSMSLIPSLNCEQTPEGKLTLTTKFLEGLKEYAIHWPGSITLFVRIVSESNLRGEMDLIEIHPNDLPCKLSLRSDRFGYDKQRLEQSDLIFLSRDQMAAHEMVRGSGIPVVYALEYPLSCRLEILAATVRNPVRRAVRTLREYHHEKRLIDNLKRSAGIQCNGTPAYEAYQALSSSAFLFFDGRSDESQVIGAQHLKERLEDFEESERPIRLAFSGRLTAMKGPQYLPQIAQDLEHIGVPYTMEIFGSGDMEESLREEVQRLQLGEHVSVKGPVHFRSELIPHMSSSIDLFVCCHVQGDPSCTYLETLSCGVPIVGFGNSALTGLSARSNSCRTVPVHQTVDVAEAIAALSNNREEVTDRSLRAREFALQHTFKKTFKKRVEHMLSCM
jgi:colanic acid/amylovoran biosynthesis glycosyltransferase